jgi:hypothetical protein
VRDIRLAIGVKIKEAKKTQTIARLRIVPAMLVGASVVVPAGYTYTLATVIRLEMLCRVEPERDCTADGLVNTT